MITSYSSIDWNVAAVAALALLVVVFAFLIATRRSLSDLRKELESLSKQVNELRRLEETRYLKGLRSNFDRKHDLKNVAAPPSAPSLEL
jgi:ABC-type Fe3+ transport system permease subunit